MSVMAGLNVRTTFNPPSVFVKPLRELVNEGAIPRSVLDARVRAAAAPYRRGGYAAMLAA